MSDNYFGTAPSPRQLSTNDIQAGVIDKTKLVAGLAQNVTTFTTSSGIAVAQAGVLVVDATSGAIVLTLPAANSASPLSYRISRKDTVFSNAVTIQRAGSDTINTLYLSIVLTPDIDTVVLDSDGVSNWRIESGTVQSPRTGRKNALINGNFDLWQRNSTFTITTSGYTADRWLATAGTGGSPSITVSKQAFTVGQILVPNEPAFFLQYQQTAIATTTVPSLEQRIESVRTFAGKTVTVSFWAQVASGTLAVTPSFVQNFGTGGSPSTAVTTTGSAITITATMTKYNFTMNIPTLNAKTLGTGGNDYLSLILSFPLSTTYVFSLSQIQVEEGSLATQFERKLRQEEVAFCQRYYTKTFPIDTTVAQNAGVPGAYTWITQTTTPWQTDWSFPVLMRAAPSITTFNPSAGNANWRDTTGTADVTVTVADTSDRKVSLQGAGTTAAHVCSIHVTASAEL